MFKNVGCYHNKDVCSNLEERHLETRLTIF